MANLTNNYNLILERWVDLLKEFIKNIENPSENLINQMKEVFICRAVSFWDEMERIQKRDWESELIELIYLVGRN